MSETWEIIAGAAALAVLHALIPNHWLPLVAIGRSEGWSRSHTVAVTGLVGLSHVIGTVILGLLVGAVGLGLAGELAEQGERVGALILVFCGAFLILRGLRHSHTCKHHHLELIGGGAAARPPLQRLGLVLSVSAAMFLSPCVEILAFFLSASVQGWFAVLTVSAVFLIITVPLLMLLVGLSVSGIERLNWHALDHHGRTLTGGLLILIGVGSLFFGH